MAERAAIVTGASSGIGLAIAKVLGEEGYGVTMAARRPDKLEAAVAELVAEGFDVHGVAANVIEEEDDPAGRRSAPRALRRLDVLVNNAGVGIGASVGEIQTKHLDMQLDDQPALDRAVLPRMRAAAARRPRRSTRNALVVNTSSISGKRGQGWLSVYSATKHGVVGWTEAMNKELAPQGIKSTRAVPRVRRHADDRVRQGARPRRGDDPARGHRRGRPLPAEASPPPASFRRSCSPGLATPCRVMDMKLGVHIGYWGLGLNSEDQLQDRPGGRALGL